MITLGTAKAALDQFVRYIALELAPHGITANLVAPATVDETKVTGQLTTEQVRHLGATNPMGRLVRPDEVAAHGGLLGERGGRFHHRPLSAGQRRPCDGLKSGFHNEIHQIWKKGFGHAHHRPEPMSDMGIHEELVAYVADQEGYYEDEGVHVAIRDGVGWETERVRRGATIGLGRALMSRLTDGIDWKMLSVNTHRPLFWFLGNADVTSMADLRGRRLAVHAGHTAPGCFARIVLRKHGLDPDRDLECVVADPGDYQMDLRRLRDGSIDAAYVGSTLSPEQVAEEEGFHLLAWVGDHFQIPTVGIAVDPVSHPAGQPRTAGAGAGQPAGAADDRRTA